MEDAVEAGEVERIAREVDTLEDETARILLLEGRVVVVRETVEPDDVVAARGQRVREMRADEARGSGHEVSHRSAIP